mmetsp:Transcript_12310/g.23554  ORF Transcript_12310/g.23554 Transcript_12310/m.23554 type:complete len:231 (+) Transcript_12310:214-906(+)
MTILAALPSPTRTFCWRHHLEEEPEEDPATTTTESVEFKACDTPTPTSSRKRRAVRFQEQDNVYHDNLTQCQEDTLQQWYSPRELMAFRQDCHDQILTLRAYERLLTDNRNRGNNNSTTTWATSLWQVYQVLCAARNASDLATLMPQTPEFHVTVHTLGMEKRAIAAIARDTAARRTQLNALVSYWQTEGRYLGNASFRTAMIRDASVNLSRPARFYARHIAVLSAATEL